MNIQKFIEVKKTKDSIVNKLEYLKNGGLDEYLAFAMSEMGLKKLPAKNQDQIIQQIISKTPNDLDKKVQNTEYYKAHLCCIKIVLEEVFLHDAFIENMKYKVKDDKDVIVYNYYHLLGEILFDMALIIQDYNRVIKKISPTKFSVGKNPFQGDFTLYQLLPQIIFGQVSFHSFIDREPFISITIIRQIIELRIRKAFGIFGIYDKNRNIFEPFPLRQIFDEIKKHQNDIDFAIPLENIIRINGWSNIYMHSGMKDYTWTLIFVYRYLRKLIKGREQGKGWSSTSGIKLKQETLDKVINGLETDLKSRNPGLELFKLQLDAFIITG